MIDCLIFTDVKRAAWLSSSIVYPWHNGSLLWYAVFTHEGVRCYTNSPASPYALQCSPRCSPLSWCPDFYTGRVSSGKDNVTVWRPSVCLSVCPVFFEPQ